MLRSENFRIAGSVEHVVQGAHEPIELTFDRVGVFDLDVFVVLDYDDSVAQNEQCPYYRQGPVVFRYAVCGTLCNRIGRFSKSDRVAKGIGIDYVYSSRCWLSNTAVCTR